MSFCWKPARQVLVILFIYTFWIAFPLFGPPISNDADDIMFVCPALELAQGKPMTAHHERDLLLAAKQDPERWLHFPPVYQEILGTWLHVFGISRRSFMLFQIAVNLGITAGLLGILHRFRVSFEWAIPPLLILCVAEYRDWGMRPEAVGVLLLILGIFFLLRRSIWRAFAAGGCLIGAGLVLQQAGIYSGLFFLIGLGASRRGAEQTGALPKWWVQSSAMAAGAIIPILFFLLGIHWDIPAFIEQYSWTLRAAGGVEATRTNILLGYWNCATVGWEWANLLMVAPLLGAAIAGLFKMRRSLERTLLGALLVGLVMNLFLVHVGSYRLSVMYFLVASAGFCLIGASSQFALWWRAALGVFCPCIAIGLSAPSLGAYFLRLPTNSEEVRKVISSQEFSSLYLDAYAAGAVFDWRLPDNVQSLRDGKGYSLQYIFGPTCPTIPSRPGELYIIEKSDYHEIPLKLMGRTLRSANVNRWQWDVVDFQGKSLLTGDRVGLPSTR